nr:twin-arginine translocase TatA/TatE family subunit [Leifsonia sp. C5G2]
MLKQTFRYVSQLTGEAFRDRNKGVAVFANLTGWHALIVVAVVVLLFGATRLPALARGVGQSVRILQKEVRGGHRDGEPLPDDRDDD